MNQRIHRAKQGIRDSGTGFRLPTPQEWPTRLRAVLHVLYLFATIGNAPGDTVGDLSRGDAAVEARPSAARDRTGCCPTSPRSAACSPSCCSPSPGAPRGPVRPASSSRSTSRTGPRWDAELIAEGSERVERAMRRGRVGAYQLQAAVAAVHAEAADWQDTDWPQIAGLYEVLAAGRPVAGGRAQPGRRPRRGRAKPGRGWRCSTRSTTATAPPAAWGTGCPRRAATCSPGPGTTPPRTRPTARRLRRRPASPERDLLTVKAARCAPRS